MFPGAIDQMLQYDPSGAMAAGLEELATFPGDVPSIPAGTAAYLGRGVTAKAGILKAVLQYEKDLEEIQARYGVSREKAAQLHQQALEMRKVDARTKRQDRILQARLKRTEQERALQIAERQAEMEARRKSAELTQLETEAESIANRIRSDKGVVGPNSPAAQTALAMLKGDRFKPIQGALRADSLQQELDARLRQGMLNVLAAEQAQWQKLGIGKKWEQYTRGLAGEGPDSPGTDPVKQLASRYEAGESPAAVLNEWRTKALQEARKERVAARAGVRMESRGDAPQIIEQVKQQILGGGEGAWKGMKAAPKETATAARKAARGTATKYGIGGAVAAALLYKLLGSDKPKNEVPAALQMAMMQQMGDGHSGGASMSPEAVEGRQLLNMQRMMSLMKMMNDMRAMQTPATPESMIY